MIQKNIIQTYESEFENLPAEAKNNILKWKSMNPDWNYLYFSENDRISFIKKEYDNSIYSMYINLPLGIMKANFFTYLALYKLGGLYTDIDHSPNISIENWLDLNKSFVVAMDEDEEDFIFSIAVIASEKNNKILSSIIEQVIESLNKYKLEPVNRYLVFKTTAEISFTKGIKKILDPEKTIPSNGAHDMYNNTKYAKEFGFYCFGGLDKNIFRGVAISNLDGANNWKIKYNSWWEKADSFYDS